MNKSNLVNNLIIIFFCLFSSSLIIIATLNHPIGLWPDSVGYIATAKNLILGKGFISFDNSPVTAWPPFYPIVLALLGLLGFNDLLWAALFANVFLFAMIIYFFGNLVYKKITTGSLVILSMFYLIFSVPVFQRTLWAGSEILFIFLNIIYFYLIEMYYEKKNLVILILISITTAVSLITRYIGITVFFTTLIFFLFIKYKHNYLKISHLILYCFLSILPLTIWLSRNYLISNKIAGESGDSYYTLMDNIIITLKNIVFWFSPTGIIRKPLLLLVIIIAFLYFIYVLYKYFDISKFLKIKDNVIFFVSSLFMIIYVLVLIVISSINSIDAINSRLLSPIYIPLIFIIFLFIDSTYMPIKTSNSFSPRKKIIVFLIVGLLYPLWSTFSTIISFYHNGAGYSGAEWNNSENINFMSQLKHSSLNSIPRYSNDPHAVYFLTNLSTKWSPQKNHYNSPSVYNRLSELQSTWPPEKVALLIWLQKEDHRNWLFKPKELSSISHLKLLYKNDQGSIYLVTRR